MSYSFKAYATNSVGTTFTSIGTFATAIPAVIAWDDFLRQQDSGAGWTSNWTGAVAGIGANLVYPGLNSGGYAAAGPVGFPGALRDLPPQTTGVVYLSALVSGTSYANVTLYNGGSELIGFGIVWSGAGPSTQYGTYDSTRSVRSYSTVNVDGGTHLVVVRVDLDANTLSGWVDPNLSAPLGAPAFSSSTTFATGYDFTKVRLELGPGSQIDELRVVRANPELLETQVTSPAISGQTATGILLTSATLGGNVTQDGALPIIERGFVISATTVNGNPIAGGVGVTTLPTTGSTGLYSLGVTSLAQGVSYSFKGYATNAIGTTYTATGTFTTLLNAAPTDITLSNASIAENNIAGATIGTLTATDADGGDTHTFTFAGGADDGAFTITGSTLTINGSADFEAKSSYTVRIRATDSGAENLAFEKDLIVSITDVTLPQTITFDPLGNKTFGDANFTVAASGGASGQPVTFSIFSGPATIDGSTVTITGAGSVTIRASQAGAGDYSAAADVDQSFSVAQATQSITFAPPASAYQPQTITLTATGGGSGNAVVFSVISGPGSLAGDALTFTGTGDVRVRASQAGNANYIAAVDVEATITVLAAGPPAVDDAVTMTTGPSVLYPLANDGAPEANILSVSNSDVVIDGRALIVPAGTTGTFTYTNDQGRTATVTVNTITPNVAPQRFSGLLYNSTGAVVGRAVTNRTAAGINTFSAQIGSATGKSVFTFPVSGNSAMGIATELGSVSATLGENGHLLVTMSGGISGDLRPSALSPTPAVYNVGLAAVSTSLKGGGFGTVRIGSGGAGKILVKMPDGRAFSAATEMADNGSVTFYGRQAATTPFGYVGGEFILAGLTKTDLTGELEWSRPAQFSRVDRAAVNTVVVANGCITNGTFGIPDGAATMTFSGGNYAAPAAYTVNVSGGAVTPFLPTLRFWTPIATSQTFKFRFLQPGRTIDSTGTGMYFQKSQTALGYFPGLLRSGKVELQCMSW